MARWTAVLAACVAVTACDSDPYVADGEPSQGVVSRVEVTLPASEMNPGDTVTATAKAFSAGGSALPFVDFVWQVTDSSVTSVEPHTPTETAKVTALTLGVSSVTARAGGISSTPALVTVVEPDSIDGSGL